jgi:arsenite-transporting ATPase
MVIKESQRAYTYLNLFGLSVDLVIANRILPPDMSNTYLEKWLSIQDKYLRVAEECFNPLPIYQARLFDQEMVGMELLNRMAEDIFQDEDPTRIMADGKPIEFIPKLGKYLLRIRFPSLTKEDFDLWVKGDELIVKAGPCKRNILLPRSLASLALKEANYANEYLEVTFGK